MAAWFSTVSGGALLALSALLGGCGGSAVDDGGIDRKSKEIRCDTAPESEALYETLAELEPILVRPWERCGEPALASEEVGVEFTSDGHYYPLIRGDSGELLKLASPEGTHVWQYLPGSGDADRIVLDGVATEAPVLNREPTQMRIRFGSAPSKYVPIFVDSGD